MSLNRKCHGLAATLGIDHDGLREMAGVDSLRELSPKQWSQLYYHLLSEYKKANGANKKQIAKIYKLGYRVLKWKGARISNFVKRQLGYYKNVENLTSKEATKVITGLEKVVKYEQTT